MRVGGKSWQSLGEKPSTTFLKKFLPLPMPKEVISAIPLICMPVLFSENMNFDSVTVAPYMGSDSVQPFLEFKDKWAIVLALTSNAGGLDFQLTQDADGQKLYQKVLKTAQSWGTTSCL